MRFRDAGRQIDRYNGPLRVHVWSHLDFTNDDLPSVFSRATPAELTQRWNRAAERNDYGIVIVGGGAWLFCGDELAARPSSLSFEPCEADDDDPVRVSAPESVESQVDDVCAEYRVRLVAQRVRGGRWCAAFIDATKTPVRVVHSRPVEDFQRETLEAAVWCAIDDIRAFGPA